MPAYKDSKTGTWFVKFYCKDWTGENKQIKKRGFVTKREALDYERNYKIRQENNLDMTFGEFWKLYTEDVKNYVKLNTWLTKEHIVDTKILPYFRNLKMNEITPGDVRKWQNEMVAFRNENGNALVFDTVDNALLRNPGAQPLFHSDRGFQYTNRLFHTKLINAGITQSMSRVAKCIDNGPMEGFWGILKRERYYGKRFTDRGTLVKMIEDYIDYYNNKRLQRNLGILTPMEKHKIYL